MAFSVYPVTDIRSFVKIRQGCGERGRGLMSKFIFANLLLRHNNSQPSLVYDSPQMDHFPHFPYNKNQVTFFFNSVWRFPSKSLTQCSLSSELIQNKTQKLCFILDHNNNNINGLSSNR